jgi:hypothetical protein
MCPASRIDGELSSPGIRVKKGQEETHRVRDRDPAAPPAEDEDPDEPGCSQPFTDSGLTGQGAKSALEHLVERERTRVDRPET